ncbi:MAG TPA: ABC transporter permease [Jiangellaceae bacterium]|nr:ABC transporter permease [Jiangellaceae bacterium]
MSGGALTHEDVTTHEVVEVRQSRRARLTIGAFFLAAGAMCVVFALWHGPVSAARFQLAGASAAIQIPSMRFSATTFGMAMAVVLFAVGGWQLVRGFTRRMLPWAIGLVGLGFVLAFLAWATTGSERTTLDIPGMLNTTVFLAVPLMLGAMAGVVSERSGVINVAIEGHMLAGAFAAAVTATIAGSLGVGVVGAVVVGGLTGALLAVFAIRYVVNQVVLGVVINLLVLGLTNYLFSAVLQRNVEAFNNPGFFRQVAIPVLAEIPLVGPALFDATLLTYAAYVIVIAVHVGLYKTRWGLRTRSVGEHPKAADTAGIEVNRLRFWNLVLAGAIAGFAGAAISIGAVGAFNSDMTAGRGFIALAAVIFGRWTPLGATGAAFLFAFTTSLQRTLSIVETPIEIPSQFLAMLPYIATIVIVAGAIGRIRPPAADGVPYTKS